MFFIQETRLGGSVGSDQTSNRISFFAFLYNVYIYIVYRVLSFCFLPLRDNPNLFYMNILKCATSINVMASALNGLQCPTTQVEDCL